MVNNHLENALTSPDLLVFMTSNTKTDSTYGIAFVGAICKLLIEHRTSINEYPPDIIDDYGAAEVEKILLNMLSIYFHIIGIGEYRPISLCTFVLSYCYKQ